MPLMLYVVVIGFLIGNDFFMPNNWLKEMLEYGEAIPNTGIMATKVSGWEEILKLDTLPR